VGKVKRKRKGEKRWTNRGKKGNREGAFRKTGMTVEKKFHTKERKNWGG